MDRTKAIANTAEALRRGVLTPEHVADLTAFWQAGHGLEVDSDPGPLTRRSIEDARRGATLLEVLAPAPVASGAVAPVIWTPWDGPLATQPRTYAEVDAWLKVPKAHVAGVESLAWKKANIVDCHGDDAPKDGEVDLRTLPGVPPKWYVAMARPVVPYLREGLRRAQLSSPYKIERIGGYVHRVIKGTTRLSPHGRGIAVDIDPAVNRGERVKRGNAPKAFSEAWYKMFPGSLDKAFVDAMKSCGWCWGADWDEDGNTDDEVWLDTMHFEWVARDGFRSDV